MKNCRYFVDVNVQNNVHSIDMCLVLCLEDLDTNPPDAVFMKS